MISLNFSRNNAILFIKLFTQLNYLSPLVMPPTVCSYIFFFLIFHPFFLPSYLLASGIWERIQFSHSVTSNSVTSWTAVRHASLSKFTQASLVTQTVKQSLPTLWPHGLQYAMLPCPSLLKLLWWLRR